FHRGVPRKIERIEGTRCSAGFRRHRDALARQARRLEKRNPGGGGRFAERLAPARNWKRQVKGASFYHAARFASTPRLLEPKGTGGSARCRIRLAISAHVLLGRLFGHSLPECHSRKVAEST